MHTPQWEGWHGWGLSWSSRLCCWAQPPPPQHEIGTLHCAGALRSAPECPPGEGLPGSAATSAHPLPWGEGQLQPLGRQTWGHTPPAAHSGPGGGSRSGFCRAELEGAGPALALPTPTPANYQESLLARCARHAHGYAHTCLWLGDSQLCPPGPSWGLRAEEGPSRPCSLAPPVPHGRPWSPGRPSTPVAAWRLSGAPCRPKPQPLGRATWLRCLFCGH